MSTTKKFNPYQARRQRQAVRRTINRALEVRRESGDALPPTERKYMGARS